MEVNPIYPEKNAIVMFCDKNYFEYINVTLQSIIDSASINNYDVVIIYDSNEKFVPSIEIPNNFSIRAVPIDIDFSKYVLYESKWISKTAYYRLFIPKIFKDYNRVLYIDCDILITKNIDELFGIKFEEDEIIGGCSEFFFWELLRKTDSKLPNQFKTLKDYYKEILNLDESYPYINSGVLLFDIEKCNDFNFTEKCFELISNNPLEDKFLLCHDQDVINSVCKHHIHFLGPEYNYMWFEVSSYTVSVKYKRKKNDELERCAKDLVAIYPNMKIIHYAGMTKPWIKPYYDYKLAVYWWRYALKTKYFYDFMAKMSSTVKASIYKMLELKENAEKNLKKEEITLDSFF